MIFKLFYWFILTTSSLLDAERKIEPCSTETVIFENYFRNYMVYYTPITLQIGAT